MDIFAAAFAALYAGHHAGDYWIQSDHDAKRKGEAGRVGRRACLRHVVTYVLTQGICLSLMLLVTGAPDSTVAPMLGALALSGVFHYAADRREHGLMFKLARAMPGKADFLRFGQGERSLATGAWALDQSWHIATSVFLPALVLAAAV